MTIRETTLDNGLRVVTDSAAHVETASVGLWVATGARFEPEPINGIAHLIEHMVFKGTARRSAQDIAEEIENVGGHLNAYTTRENTAFHAKVLKADLALAVDIISDMVRHPAFDGAELARERAVVLQEIGQAQDTPDDIIYDHLQTVCFPDQPLGRPVLGSTETVSDMAREALVDFLGAQYGAARAVFAAAGNVEHERVVALAEAALGDLPAGAPAVPEPARYRGGETRVDEDLEQVHILLAFEAPAVTDPDVPALAVFSAALGGGMSSRLFQELREKRGLVYSVYSSASAYADSGLFRIYAGTGEHEAAELIPVMCAEIASLADAIGEAELERAKAQLRAQYLMSLESMDNRAEQHALQLLRLGRVISDEEMVGRIDAVEAAAVARVARRVLGAEPSVAVLGPVAEVEPFERIRARLAA